MYPLPAPHKNKSHIPNAYRDVVSTQTAGTWMENRSGVNHEVSNISTTKELGSIRYIHKEKTARV